MLGCFVFNILKRQNQGKKMEIKRFSVLLFLLSFLLFASFAAAQTSANSAAARFLSIKHPLGEVRIIESKQVVKLDFHVEKNNQTKDFPKAETTEKKFIETTIISDVRGKPIKLNVKIVKYLRRVKENNQQEQVFPPLLWASSW